MSLHASLHNKAASYLHNLLSELVDDKLPVPLMLIDNQSAIHMAANGDQMQRTRHMPPKFNYLRDLVSRGQLQLLYCPTNYMAADMISKHVTKVILDTGIGILGMGGCCGFCP